MKTKSTIKLEEEKNEKIKVNVNIYPFFNIGDILDITQDNSTCSEHKLMAEKNTITSADQKESKLRYSIEDNKYPLGFYIVKNYKSMIRGSFLQFSLHPYSINSNNSSSSSSSVKTSHMFLDSEKIYPFILTYEWKIQNIVSY